jgi:hypothetical protein
LSGVSIAANASNYIMLTIARAPTDLAGLNTPHTIWVLAAGNLQGNVWGFFSQGKTATHPAITFEPGSHQFVIGFTEQNAPEQHATGTRNEPPDERNGSLVRSRMSTQSQGPEP